MRSALFAVVSLLVSFSASAASSSSLGSVTCSGDLSADFASVVSISCSGDLSIRGGDIVSEAGVRIQAGGSLSLDNFSLSGRIIGLSPKSVSFSSGSSLPMGSWAVFDISQGGSISIGNGVSIGSGSVIWGRVQVPGVSNTPSAIDTSLGGVLISSPGGFVASIGGSGYVLKHPFVGVSVDVTSPILTLLSPGGELQVISPVPEPQSFLQLLLGLAVIGFWVRHKSQAFKRR